MNPLPQKTLGWVLPLRADLNVPPTVNAGKESYSVPARAVKVILASGDHCPWSPRAMNFRTWNFQY
jgi:hypothetical protein